MSPTMTTEPPQAGPPTRPDGSLFTYEMLYAGLTQRAYADTAEELLDVLIPGYAAMTGMGKWEARIAMAIKAQVITQAVLNTMDAFHTLTPVQQEILQGPRHEPPVVAAWDCPVPLVLVAHYYTPAGNAPAPVRTQGMAPNVIWINPSDDTTLLDSLHDVGVIALHTSA